MEKYHKTDIAPVENENERDDTYQAVNPQIDFTRTQNNYNIIKRQRSYTQFINDKIEALDLPTKVRKDAVLMCSFVIGSDREFFGRLSPQEQQQFFVGCTRFFAERYGEENIISAVVHMDETTPHLHLNLIPIADGRLCAKTLFDRKELQNLQSDFHSVVGKKWNLQRGKEGSQAKHLDTAAFKLKKMSEAADQAELRANEAESRKALAEQRQVHAERKTQQLEDRQKQLQRDTALHYKLQPRFCWNTRTEGASSTKGICPSLQQKSQSSKPKMGNSKSDCKSAPATSTTCSISIKRRSEKSRYFKATPTSCAR